jgi:hypothetical protein
MVIGSYKFRVWLPSVLEFDTELSGILNTLWTIDYVYIPASRFQVRDSSKVGSLFIAGQSVANSSCASESTTLDRNQ